MDYETLYKNAALDEILLQCEIDRLAKDCEALAKGKIFGGEPEPDVLITDNMEDCKDFSDEDRSSPALLSYGPFQKNISSLDYSSVMAFQSSNNDNQGNNLGRVRLPRKNIPDHIAQEIIDALKKMKLNK